MSLKSMFMKKACRIVGEIQDISYPHDCIIKLRVEQIEKKDENETEFKPIYSGLKSVVKFSYSGCQQIDYRTRMFMGLKAGVTLGTHGIGSPIEDLEVGDLVDVYILYEFSDKNKSSIGIERIIVQKTSNLTANLQDFLLQIKA